eukprot:TRINITY_DN1243_c0_g1_i2.p1 TRINITY_DN1243_c0_g1~~TRINITY_DN1243_c0_g1_i2.p1  ORF type:complete len:308 (-),score=128.94 TRINITY_DN1243_c0_g1_i2:35-958(-)
MAFSFVFCQKMNVVALGTALDLRSAKVTRKAQEYDRILTAKAPSGFGQKGELCRPVACLELASRLLGEPFNVEKAMKLSGAPSKLYPSVLNNIRNFLQIKSTLTMKQLAVQFGCLNQETGALRLLDMYKAKVEEETGPTTQCDFSHPVYVTVAFYATCLRLKPAIVIDRKKLLQVSGVSIPIFREKLNDIVRLCFPDLAEKQSQKKITSSSSSSSSSFSSSSSSSCVEIVEESKVIEVTREEDEDGSSTVVSLGKRQRQVVEVKGEAPTSPQRKKARHNTKVEVEIKETESVVVSITSSSVRSPPPL